MGYYDDFQSEIPDNFTKFVPLEPHKLFAGEFVKKEKHTDPTYGDTGHWFFKVTKPYTYMRKKKGEELGEETLEVGETVILNQKYWSVGKKGDKVATRFFIAMKENDVVPGDIVQLCRRTGKTKFDTVYEVIVLERGPGHEQGDTSEAGGEDA